MCIYIYIYISISIYLSIYIYIYMHTYTYTCVCVCVRVCACACVCVLPIGCIGMCLRYPIGWRRNDTLFYNCICSGQKVTVPVVL